MRPLTMFERGVVALIARALGQKTDAVGDAEKLERIKTLIGPMAEGGKPHMDHGVLHAPQVDHCLTCAIKKVLDG